MAQPKDTNLKQTRRWVLIADKIADNVISIGGLLVICAVFGMMLFLVFEVIPLFTGGSVESRTDYTIEGTAGRVLALSLDEQKTIAVRIVETGALTAWHASTGTILEAPSFDLQGKKIAVLAGTLDGRHAAFGFGDGTVRFADIAHKADVNPIRDLPEGLTRLNDRDLTDGTAVYSHIPGKQFRKTWIEVKLHDEIKAFDSGSPIIAMDYRFSQFGERPSQILAAIDQNGQGRLLKVESKLNLFTRKLKTEVSQAVLPALPQNVPIVHALVNEAGDTVYFAQKDGTVYRFNVRDFENPFLAETAQLTKPGVSLNVFGYLLGEVSVVAGGSDGSVNIYFLLRQRDPDSQDGFGIVHTRTFDPQPAAIVGFAASQRGRCFLTQDAAGSLWLRQGTSERTLLGVTESRGETGTGKGKIILAPRRDGIMAVFDDGTTNLWDIDVPHPESSLRTLFGKVWYEGSQNPTYTWQSTGATDAFEPKLSIVPLVFGTMKATFYALLFAIPIAILAAIYTSEFLPGGMRGKIKPAIEVMASIPSVVLGFIAALVLAPVVENWVAAVIMAFVSLPLSLMLAAYLWQLLPPPLAVRFDGIPKFLGMLAAVMVGLYITYSLGPLFERVFFAGDFKAWVNQDVGKAAPFWFLLLLPLSAIGVSTAANRFLGNRFNQYLKKAKAFSAALMDLGRWLGIAAGSIVVSYGIAVILQGLGFDARGTVVDTYAQRNTLVVGFAMGFAVIPLIYTLAEDALNAVPAHLRSASLGCGATPWQTAVWIVLPTAISGVFSAMMIGMGRAVGETMIVVMSTGNTPLTDMNIFNGLRALSANIAVELPEAPKDDTLYRLLFFTGLVLFGMTFVINTVAEIVRLRFRRRSAQL